MQRMLCMLLNCASSQQTVEHGFHVVLPPDVYQDTVYRSTVPNCRRVARNCQVSTNHVAQQPCTPSCLITHPLMLD